MKYLCLFAASFMLLFWHLTKVSQHTLIPLAGHSEASGTLSTHKWKQDTEVDDGTWKVPLEAHIMFVFSSNNNQSSKPYTNATAGPNALMP